MSSTVEVRGTGDDALAIRSWPPPDSPKADVLLVHGLAEHSGRFEHVGDFLTGAGYRVTGLDLPGCGRSGGRRAYVSSMDDFLAAVESVLETTRSGLPVVLYGHSMGGLVSLSYALSDRPAPDLLVLSAPAIDGEAPGWQRKLAPVLGRWVPTAELPNPVDGAHLSRDPAVAEAYFADPLVYTKATMSLGKVLFESMDAIKEDMRRLDVPTYVFHGGQDKLVPPQFSAPLAELDGVTRRLWTELRHETHNEPEWEEVLGEVVAWLDEAVSRVSAGP